MLTPRNLVSDRPPLQSLVRITLNVVLGFVILGPIIGLTAADAIYDGDLLNDVQHMTMGPGFMEAMFLMQGTVTFVGLILLPVIHLTRLEHKSLAPFFPPQPKTWMMLVVVAAIGIAFPTSISPLAEWNLNMKFPEFMSGFEEWAMQEEDRLAKLTEALTAFGSVGDLMIGLVVIALLPAIGEELVFRGLLQGELWRSTLNIHVAIWVSSVIFSAIHMQFYGFIPRLLLGALFGYLYYWSGNLLIPMFSHFLNNAFAVIMVYLNHMKLIDVNLENGEAVPPIYVMYGVVISTGLLYFTWKHYRTLNEATE